MSRYDCEIVIGIIGGLCFVIGVIAGLAWGILQ